MNLVIRYRWENGSLILKQSKPYVNKYPSIPAPQERIATEAIFYQYASQSAELLARMPEVLHYDADNHLIVMQDLGVGKDFTHLYRKDQQISDETLHELLFFLRQLHGLDLSQADKDRFPDNLKLRQLNHQHIFVLPYDENNGFDLDQIQEGLGALAVPYTQDQALKKAIYQLGEQYLSVGSVLIHGDYYPGSWMLSEEQGLRIIDPEFGFIGPAEFELGVLIAHLLMCGLSLEPIQSAIATHYQSDDSFDLTMAGRFAGVEIMRRIIGIAQLPLDMTVNEKSDLLAQARNLILQ